MLTLKVLFFFIALAKANRCQSIQTIFYQTEDQYYAKGCDSNQNTNPFQVSEFEKQCQLLQKKMDIFGHRFYGFGVSFDLQYSITMFKLLVFLGMVKMD